eukprot:233773-Prorocentrum_minimum.AAC.1
MNTVTARRNGVGNVREASSEVVLRQLILGTDTVTASSPLVLVQRREAAEVVLRQLILGMDT